MSETAFSILLRRLAAAIPILLVVSALVFVVLRLIPADPLGMSLPPNAPEADVETMRHEMGLDRPIPEQYAIWLGHIVRGDFGISSHFRQRVTGLIFAALPTTLELVAAGLLLGITLGLVGGLAMFAGRGRLTEQVTDLGSIVVMSIPEFLWAIFLILGVGVGLRLLPFIGRIDPQMKVPDVTGF